MNNELLLLLARINVAQNQIAKLVSNPTDPYYLSDTRKLLGSLEFDVIEARHALDKTIAGLGYTWENTYSPEARLRLKNERSG